MKVIIATIKQWNIKNAKEFKARYKDVDIYLITGRDQLNYDFVSKVKPDFIFFPHWSWLIPKKIYSNYNCVVFHMTDLPYGRGGSPLQNLIVRGIENTKISAIKVDDGIDTGDIYLKKDLNLNGTAEEILIRASKIIFDEMIPEIINNQPVPVRQQGQVVEFKRRSPDQGEIQPYFSLEKIFDYIRMLDGEGYPRAFIRFGKYRLEFSRASLKTDRLIADVEFIEDDKDE